MRIHSMHRDRSGFTLIEVMIAVVVLATGLLAMAALQAKLAANSADAKARSRIATLITGVIDKERALGYSNIGPFGPLTASAGACLATSDASLVTLTQKIQNDINCAQSDAGVSGVSLTQTMTRYYAGPTAGSFTTTAPAASVTIYGDYKQIKLTANWNDATGATRSLAVDTITSDLNLNANTNTVLAQNLTASGNLVPVVHELNPSNTAGVIPIAIGDNTNAASTNPKPTVSTSGANSTTFNTLTYTQGANDTAATSTIQKRVETEVAECVCQGSSSNPFASDTLFGENTFRPTYWNGTQYTSPAIVTGGVPHSAASTNITQSAECDVCCRDHNDTGIATTAVRYDAVTGDTKRYKVKKTGSNVATPVALDTDASGNPIEANITADAYLDACRMIRVDGLWRVATDIEASHIGLIATNDEQGTSTNPATPYPAKQTLYEAFVVNGIQAYLESALPTAGSPNWVTFLTDTLADLYTASAPDVPSTTPVLASTSSGSYRYLHAHGLYIDHLEKEALDKLNAVLSSTCPATATDYPTCLLPYLPFSTINISGLANWSDQRDTSDAAGNVPLGATVDVLSLGSGTSTSSTCASGTFFGGCVTGVTAGYGYATATIGHSNSGIAYSIPVSPYELDSTKKLTAAQQFRVTSSSTSDVMYGQVFGPDLQPTGFNSTIQFATDTLNSQINPALTWSTGGANGNCSVNSARQATTPNPYKCSTTVALSTPTTITVGGSKSYNQLATAVTYSSNPCPGATGNTKHVGVTVKGLICYRLSTATLTNASGTRIDCNTTTNPASCYNIGTASVANSGTALETTAVPISSVTGTPAALSNSTLNLTFVYSASRVGSYTCDANNLPQAVDPTSCN
jgi:prepilin-type N-terminal cleavage/methylation domain-containing protein